MYKACPAPPALPPAFLHEFKGHAIIARKGGEPGNEAKAPPLAGNYCVTFELALARKSGGAGAGPGG